MSDFHIYSGMYKIFKNYNSAKFKEISHNVIFLVGLLFYYVKLCHVRTLKYVTKKKFGSLLINCTSLNKTNNN